MKENRIKQLFRTKSKNILSVYFTAGFPNLNDTVQIIQELEKNSVDLIEIGMPFSDPIADGAIIQKSNNVALENGISLNLLFKQLKDIRKNVNTPLVLMGYFNPVYQYGVKEFCEKCAEVGIDGTIIPDLPLNEFEERYKTAFENNNLYNIFLITPQTSDERIKEIDNASRGFIYMVSSSSTTGIEKNITDFNIEYFKHIKNMHLKNPCIIGFGIANEKTFKNACKYTNGAIVGSAFINSLNTKLKLESSISVFVNSFAH